MPTTNLQIIRIVVFTLALDSVIALCTLGYCMIFGIDTDPTLNTAFVGLAGTLFGTLAGMLTRTQPQTTQGPTQSVPIQPISTEPIPVKVENSGESEAVPTKEL